VIRKLLLVFVLSLLLPACKSQLQSPGTPPANFRVTAGDSQAVLTWTMEPGQTYSVYYQVGPEVSPANYVGFASPAVSPFTVTGLVDQTQYAFIVDASNQGSVPGPPTPIVTVTPGGTGAGQAWTVGGGLTAQTLHSVAYGNEFYVAVGDAGAVYVVNVSTASSSGIGTWNPPNGLLPTGLEALAAVVFTGSGFTALADQGDVISSTNTETWTSGQKATVTGSPQMTALASGAGTLVAVGFNSTILTNSSLTASAPWVTRNAHLPQQEQLYGISYVNGKFIAVGQSGTLLTSDDGGATWVVENSTVTVNLYKAAYGAGGYVVVGDAGTILWSPDAVNWVQETAPTSEDLYGVAYGVDAEFVVVGINGVLLSSPLGTDGTWTVTGAGGTTLNDVVAGNTVFVAVGDVGANISGK